MSSTTNFPSQPQKKQPGVFVLFWDYDTQWGADRSRSPGGTEKWGHLEFENTERLLELHAQFGVRACFAVVGAAALPGARPYHDPDQIRRIFSAGHEIASHSFHHDWLPALGRAALKGTLTRSRDALEQCIGAQVISFVPPWNQPFDYVRKLSVSLSERRQVRKDRTDVKRLCETLAQCGYQFSRISYRPAHLRFMDLLCKRAVDVPVQPTVIEGIVSLRVNTPGGFDDGAEAMVLRCAAKGGFAIVYGHPHSISAPGPQSEAKLVSLLRLVDRLRKEGRLQVMLPNEIVEAVRPARNHHASPIVQSARG